MSSIDNNYRLAFWSDVLWSLKMWREWLTLHMDGRITDESCLFRRFIFAQQFNYLSNKLVPHSSQGYYLLLTVVVRPSSVYTNPHERIWAHSGCSLHKRRVISSRRKQASSSAIAQQNHHWRALNSWIYTSVHSDNDNNNYSTTQQLTKKSK